MGNENRGEGSLVPPEDDNKGLQENKKVGVTEDWVASPDDETVRGALDETVKDSEAEGVSEYTLTVDYLQALKSRSDISGEIKALADGLQRNLQQNEMHPEDKNISIPHYERPEVRRINLIFEKLTEAGFTQEALNLMRFSPWASNADNGSKPA